METFERKGQKYYTDTNSFVELSANSLNDILNRVIEKIDFTMAIENDATGSEDI